MGFHFELLIFCGMIFAEVAVVAGIAYLVLRFVARIVRRERNGASSPR